MQLQRAGACTKHVPSSKKSFVWPTKRVCCAASQQPPSQTEPTASTSAPAAEQAAVTREFTALGSKVVESNVAFKGPEDDQDFWEGEKFEAFGKALENYFIPGLIALGLVCGGIAAKSYNEGATAFVKPAPGPESEASIIIAIPEAQLAAPSPRS